MVVNYLKAWHHYLGSHKTKVFTDNISLRYFETQPRVTTKQLRWHDTLALMDIKLIHKLNKNNVVLDVESCKEGIPRGNVVGKYSNFLSHVCWRK
jgi:hypothetical protein